MNHRVHPQEHESGDVAEAGADSSTVSAHPGGPELHWAPQWHGLSCLVTHTRFTILAA